MEVTISQEVNLLSEATGKFDSNFFWKYLSSKVIKKILVIHDSQVPAKHIIMQRNVNCSFSSSMKRTFTQLCTNLSLSIPFVRS